MAKFNKRFFKSYLLNEFGDTPATRKVMSILNLSMMDNEYKTWKEFAEIFEFVLR